MFDLKDLYYVEADSCYYHDHTDLQASIEEITESVVSMLTDGDKVLLPSEYILDVMTRLHGSGFDVKLTGDQISWK